MFAAVIAAVTLVASLMPTPVPTPTVLQPQQYQVFVRHLPHEREPFCAVLASAADWRRVLAPAAVGFGNKPFAPPTAWWRTHAVLFVARSSAMSSAPVLRINTIMRDGASLTLHYTFTPPPPASATMNTWIGLVVEKPLPKHVTFYENGHRVCGHA
ncbi:MAG: hypothetical protein KGN02_13090 [bacterium]|nr:hypothetical protein [bacterium]